MALLKDLHAKGRTVIVITHDAEVAAHADRRIDIADGRITSDTGTVHGAAAPSAGAPAAAGGGTATTAQVFEAVQTAFRSLEANLFRTALPLLGVVIAVSAVVVMLAVGEAGPRHVLRSAGQRGGEEWVRTCIS